MPFAMQTAPLFRAVLSQRTTGCDPGEIQHPILQNVHVGSQRAKSTIKHDELKTGDRGKRNEVRIRPYLRGGTAEPREPTKLGLDGLGFSKQRDPVVGADLVPQGPRLEHCLHIVPHDHWGCQKSKNSDLRDSTEEELFFAGLFKPPSSLLRVDVAAPEKRQPDISIKEIQDVHRSVRWSDRLSSHPRQSTETSLAGSEDACFRRG